MLSANPLMMQQFRAIIPRMRESWQGIGRDGPAIWQVTGRDCQRQARARRGCHSAVQTPWPTAPRPNAHTAASSSGRCGRASFCTWSRLAPWRMSHVAKQCLRSCRGSHRSRPVGRLARRPSRGVARSGRSGGTQRPRLAMLLSLAHAVFLSIGSARSLRGSCRAVGRSWCGAAGLAPRGCSPVVPASGASRAGGRVSLRQYAIASPG